MPPKADGHATRRRVRVIAFAIFAVALAYLTIASQVSHAFNIENPRTAIAWAPWDTRARSNVAWLETEAGAGPSRHLARELAIQVLRANGNDVTALRVMGYTADNPARAERWFRLAEANSRRDFPTQLWLLEAAVGRNDIPDALLHYDIGLRTSSLAPPLLLPVLAKAIDDSQISAALGHRLQAWPVWSVWFFREAIKSATSDQNLATLGMAAAHAPAPDQTEVVSGLIKRFADRREYGLARQIYLANTLKIAGKGIVQDPTFARQPLYPLFDWVLSSGDPVDASFYKASGSSALLTARNSTGSGGEAIAQIIQLPSTGAELRMTLDVVEGDASAAASLICLDDRSPLRSLEPVDPIRSKHFAFNIEPGGCRFARIALALQPGSPGSSLTLSRFDIVAVR